MSQQSGRCQLLAIANSLHQPFEASCRLLLHQRGCQGDKGQKRFHGSLVTRPSGRQMREKVGYCRVRLMNSLVGKQYQWHYLFIQQGVYVGSNRGERLRPDYQVEATDQGGNNCKAAFTAARNRSRPLTRSSSVAPSICGAGISIRSKPAA